MASERRTERIGRAPRCPSATYIWTPEAPQRAKRCGDHRALILRSNPKPSRTLSVQADITGSTLRLILRLDSLHSRAQRRGVRALCLFLLPLVLPFLPYGHSENCSLKLPRIRYKYGRVRGVEQHRQQGRRLRNGAGRAVETPGSTCDLISRSFAVNPSREIYAKGSLREPDRQ